MMVQRSRSLFIGGTAFALASVALPSSEARAATSICDSTAGNLVLNCGFETGDFTNWTLGNNQGSVVQASGTDYLSHSGSYYAGLGNVGSIGTISQTISDAANQSYTLTYYFASHGDSDSSFSASWDGTTLGTVLTDPTSNSAYVLYSFLVTGTGSDTPAEQA